MIGNQRGEAGVPLPFGMGARDFHGIFARKAGNEEKKEN